MEENVTKVVINWADGKAAIGVSRTDCDPVLRFIEGPIEEAIEHSKLVVLAAEEQWQENPRYPKSERDLTPPKPAPAPRQASSQPKPVPKKKQQEAVQEKFF